MKNFMTSLLAVFAVALALTLPPAQAATPDYATTIPGVVVLPIHLSGQYTADTADVAQLQLPFRARVIGVSATARASGGTTPTLTVDVQDDDTTLLAAPMSITAGTITAGSITAAEVADESELTIDLAIGGTSPTWDDITVLITVIRE